MLQHPALIVAAAAAAREAAQKAAKMSWYDILLDMIPAPKVCVCV